MALLDPSSVDIKWCLKDEMNSPIMGVFIVKGGTTDAFPVFFLSDDDTTFYYWPTAATGALRYGTTAPTTAATRATAGSAQ